MINVRITHPTLYRAIVSMSLLDILLGLTLLFLPGSTFLADVGPTTLNPQSHIWLGVLLLIPGSALIPGIFRQGTYPFVQRVLIFDMAVWVFLTISSLITVMFGNSHEMLAVIVCGYVAYHRYNVISEPPINPASILGSEGTQQMTRGYDDTRVRGEGYKPDKRA